MLAAIEGERARGSMLGRWSPPLIVLMASGIAFSAPGASQTTEAVDIDQLLATMDRTSVKP